MGLSIYSYKNFREMDCNNLEKSENILFLDELPDSLHEVLKSDCYTYDEEIEISIGYSNYSMWLGILDDFDRKEDFEELLDFSDFYNGFLSSNISKKLYESFNINFEKVSQFIKTLEEDEDSYFDLGEWWLDVYREWMNIFKIASQNGLVVFC